jgi:general secretion pathway protein J
MEMMVVMLLLSVLLLLVAGGLVAAARSSERASDYVTSLEQIRAAQRTLRATIGAALPLPLPISTMPSSPKPVLFDGRADELSFVAPLAPYLGGGLRLHTVKLTAHQLQMTLAMLDPIRPWGDAQGLLSDVVEGRFWYTGNDPQGKPTGWLEQWPWTDRLPKAVRVDMSVAGPVAWPSMQINLYVDLASPATP